MRWDSTEVAKDIGRKLREGLEVFACCDEKQGVRGNGLIYREIAMN